MPLKSTSAGAERGNKKMISGFALRSMLGTAGTLLLLADVAGEAAAQSALPPVTVDAPRQESPKQSERDDQRAADACGEQGETDKSQRGGGSTGVG